MVDYISFGKPNWQKFYLYSGQAKRREATTGSKNTDFNKMGMEGRKRTQFLGITVSTSRRNFSAI